MEASGVTPHVAVHAPDLAELVQQPGPFLSLYLTTEAEIENAAQREQLRWKNVRDDAAAQGADEAALAAVDPLVGEAHLQGQTLAVIVAGGGKHTLVDHHPEPPNRDLVRWAPLPSVGPLVEWRQLQLPHVIVVADRAGADLVAVTPTGQDIHLEAGGADDPLHKAKAGGWSQRRYQQRAENTWEHNADDAAEQLVRLIETVEARVVVLAGDVRAVTMLQEALPDQHRELVHVVEGDNDAIANETVRLVATQAAADTVAVLQKFKEEKGQHDRAADGVAATVEALAKAQVEVLLVHDDPDDDRTAWFGPEPLHLALVADDVRGMGVDEPQQGRLLDVLLRAALGTGAGVRVVPSTAATDGVGAILRWSD